ncbi:MAG: Ppx/GppA phosphatase family protein [Deltaproteobacteria bacterium]|nr:Ppx/GppA phosphatase family protein [Deltaproteobacteria bacterium]
MSIAAIDIGTHSVLLTIAEKKSDGTIVALVEEATLTRIGEGIGSSNQFLPSGMERTLACLKKYKAICDQHSVQKIIAVGTAAFRKAQNAGDFVKQVQKECGIKIEIISGEREAALTYGAATHDFGDNILVLDIGGGSTEMITSESAVSVPIGSVYLTEKYVHTDPISAEDFGTLSTTIDENLHGWHGNPVRGLPLGDGQGWSDRTRENFRLFVATAGTPTTLAAIDRKMKVYKHNEIHGSKLSLKTVQNIIADLKSKTVEERKKIPGLEPGRADVILAGALLLEKVAQHFGFQEITVSDRGVRWGLLYFDSKGPSKSGCSKAT